MQEILQKHISNKVAETNYNQGKSLSLHNLLLLQNVSLF